MTKTLHGSKESHGWRLLVAGMSRNGRRGCMRFQYGGFGCEVAQVLVLVRLRYVSSMSGTVAEG